MTINALSILPGKTASCSVMGDYAIKKKQTIKWGKHKPGDIVLYDFNHNGTSDHTGIVEKINGNGTIDVIEGNTDKNNDANGGAVQRRTRSRSQVNYFVRPKYTAAITAKMVLDTARAELGTKEKPAGSNKVKYNTWYYGRKVKGDAYPWCMVFVCWIFAHVIDPSEEKSETKKTEKPATGTYTGSYPTKTLQKGDKGAQVRLWQKFLKWMGYDIEADGDFGKATKKATKKAQKAFGFRGKDVDGVVGPQTIKAAKAYKKTVKKKTEEPVKKPVEKQEQKTPEKAQKVAVQGLKKVIDISYWQAVADLSEAKSKAGVDGVIIRTSYTSQSKFELAKDSRFKGHIESAIKAGLPVGVYHYSQAISEAEAKKEAAYILKIIEPYKNRITLPVVCDWEFGGRLNSISAKKLGKSGATKVVSAFCNQIIEAGYTAMLYANYSTFKNYLDFETLKGRYYIWLAQYAKTPSLSYDLWQYTSSGKISGVSGSVDVNKGSGRTTATQTVPERAVAWARKIAKDGSYGYKHWDNKDAKTKQCPICHDLKGKYHAFNCIGFVTAAYYHGGGVRTIKCSCSGLGTDGFLTKVTEKTWRDRNGQNWNMIGTGSKGGASLKTSQLKAGDVLVCYDADGKFHHMALYSGSGKYIDCTNTSKVHIAERDFSNLTKRYHVTRAFRYTGK